MLLGSVASFLFEDVPLCSFTNSAVVEEHSGIPLKGKVATKEFKKLFSAADR